MQLDLAFANLRDPAKRCDLPGRLGCPGLPRAEHPHGARHREPPGDGEHHHIAQRHEADLELRRHPESAPAAAARGPEQIRVLICVRGHHRAGSIDQLDRSQKITRQAVRSGQETKTAAQHVPGHPDGRTRPRRKSKSRRFQRRVDAAERASGPGRHHPALGIESDAVKHARVDDDAFAFAESLIAMAAAAHRERHGVVAHPVDHGSDALGGPAHRSQLRALHGAFVERRQIRRIA